MRLAIGFYGIVALFAVGYATFSGTLGTLLGTRWPAPSHLLAAVGIGAILVAAARVGVQAWKPISDASRTLEGMVGPLSWKDAVALAFLSAVGEEVLFRGALWPHLDLAGSALLFGLVHVLPRRTLWVYPVFATVAGILLGILREGSGSVLPPIVAHFVVNAVNLAWLGGRARKALEAPAAGAASPMPSTPPPA
jgi:membrane protease YdiL (CAAX protease family)